MKYSVILVALAFCFPARAWDDGGHMLIAQIAYSRMSAKARQSANEVLMSLPDHRPSTPTIKPRAYDFVAAACWMDDIRGVKKYDEFQSWHYINPPENGDVRAAKKPNALTAIEYTTNVLKSESADAQSKALALAILLHVVGDIHQPLHATGQDLGGNTFAISGVPDLPLGLRRDEKIVDKTMPESGDNALVYQRLHAFWDTAYRYDVVERDGKKSVAQLYYLGSSGRPDPIRIAQIAQDLTAQYLPSDQALLRETDTVSWIAESNKLSSEFVFQTPRTARPTDEYFERAYDESCTRIALAGYRLAKLLNQIFDSPED